MKIKFLGGVAIVLMMLGMARMAQAIPVSEIGSVDTLVSMTNLANSGDDAEIAWVKSVIGVDPALALKIDSVQSSWEIVTGAGVAVGTFAHSLAESPEFFLIKTGKIDKSDTYRDFLFQNLPGLDYAVINLGDLGFSSKDILNVSKISHIGEFNPSVPVPGTVWLFGTGIIGLLAARRKK
ncbi:MAG: PEP-CTERM sorting domain-containing protein [Deltaproteobacteria bacterium]|nr:PEP-CTERM sorting domain-containing protein [Deltaproteobacteria bacterium]